MKGKLFIFISLFGLTFISAALYRLWQTNLPLVSPVDLISSIPRLAPVFNRTGSRIVFGFLPYWNMKDSDKLFIKPLTHLAYFGVDLNPDGTIRKYDLPKEKEPGWNKLNSQGFDILSRQIKLLGKKLILVVQAMDTDQIESLINDSANRQTAIDSVLELVAQKGFDGINVDFEYVGHPDSVTQNNFTRFVTDLTTKCKMLNARCEISIDIFADSAIKTRLYDLPVLNKVVDQIIVMAYDFYRPRSAQSGPVAPLRGKCLSDSWLADSNNCLDYDVVTSISDIVQSVSSRKLILGIPFYGYEWQTVDNQFMSRTYPDTGQIATYKRIQSLFSDSTISSLSAVLSATTLSPYLSYTKDGKIYQVHYEDSHSLKLKIDLVHQSKLGGLAIWALGYELPFPDLWQTIESNL